MKIIHTAVVLSGLILSGCSVMHFKNGPAESAGPVQEAWHHNVAYSLMEVSKPIDLKTVCGGKVWTRVTTQETFISGLAGGVDNALTSFVVPGGIEIWDPQIVQWTCADAGSSSLVPAPAATADSSAAPAGGETP